MDRLWIACWLLAFPSLLNASQHDLSGKYDCVSAQRPLYQTKAWFTLDSESNYLQLKVEIWPNEYEGHALKLYRPGRYVDFVSYKLDIGPRRFDRNQIDRVIEVEFSIFKEDDSLDPTVKLSLPFDVLDCQLKDREAVN